VGAHHKEVNPVKNGFLLRTEQQLATLGPVNDEDDVVLLAEAGNGLQREDSPTLAGHLVTEQNREFLKSISIFQRLSDGLRVFFEKSPSLALSRRDRNNP